MNRTISESERLRRKELVIDSKAALAQHETFEARVQTREDLADIWAKWFRVKMNESGYTDPVRLLPDAFARLEQSSKDYAAAAVAELREQLVGALK